jgi:hypothetical protein
MWSSIEVKADQHGFGKVRDDRHIDLGRGSMPKIESPAASQETDARSLGTLPNSNIEIIFASRETRRSD